MDNKKIGNFIKELRKNKQLTQQELAEALYVERTTINKWEHGINTVTASNIKLLADFFEVTADEILAGEKYNNKNKDKIDNVVLEVYGRNTVLSKKIKIIWITFLFFIVAFLVYFFMTFYNSVKIFNISLENEDFVSGNLIKTSDYIYMYFSSNIENPKSMNIYYLDNGEKKYLVKASYKASISIIDYIDYQEYFDFSKFNEYINNLYIEIELESEIKSEKLIFTRVYSNKKVFFKRKSGFVSNKDSTSKSNDFEYKSKIEALNKAYNGEAKTVRYKGVKYEVFVFDDIIDVEYEEKGDKFCIHYSIFNYEYIYKTINEKTIYDVNISNTDNLDALDDYNLMKNIIDYLISLEGSSE